MDGIMPYSPLEPSVHQALEELHACNEVTGNYGLTLSEREMQQLAARRVDALRSSGRVEFAGGVMQQLSLAFCDSPYVTQENYAALLGDLMESFYYFKNESMDTLADDELIDLMKRYFDDVCHGSLDYLNTTSLEEMCRNLRFGRGAEDDGCEPPDDLDPEEAQPF